jgi:photosystem II stability/assembly factor-like uncharacterized protein
MFIAVGHNGLRTSSPDGSTWEHVQTGKEGEVYRAAAFGAGRFAAVGSYGGDNLLARTTDGAEWETSKIEAKYVKYLRGLTFGKDTFLALGGDPGAVGDSKPFVATSTDGKTWSPFHDVTGKHLLRRAAWGNDHFVAVGDRGRRATSPDGLTWEDAPETKAIDTLVDVTFGNGRFVGVGLHGLRMHSEDGLKWSTPERGNEGEHLNTVLFTGEQFVAIGAGATYVSANGQEWKRHANESAPTTACYGGGLFVGSLWRGRLVLSDDGIRWREVFKAPEHAEAVVYGKIE